MTTQCAPALPRFKYASREHASQSIDGTSWVVMDDVGCRGREIGSIQELGRWRLRLTGKSFTRQTLIMYERKIEPTNARRL